MRLYYVNPADVNDIHGPYETGQTGVVLPDGVTISRIPSNPAPESLINRNLYLAIEADPTPPQFQQFDSTDLSLVPPVIGDSTARVQEVHNFVQEPIETVYQKQLQNVRWQDRDARYNSIDTALAANWWIVSSEEARSELNSIGTGLLTRLRQVQTGVITSANWYPSGANGPRIAIYNASTGAVRREQPSEAQYLTVMAEVALHDQACGAATHAALQALDAAYANGAGNWTDVANFDPANPTWGYPAFAIVE